MKWTSGGFDYGSAEIGGARYLLPLQAVVETQVRSQTDRNEVSFGPYRKFSSESAISSGRSRGRPTTMGGASGSPSRPDRRKSAQPN
jgi:hypothetical protein